MTEAGLQRKISNLSMKKTTFSPSKKATPPPPQGLHLTDEEMAHFRSFLLTKKSDILNRSHEFQARQRVGRDVQMDEAELAAQEISESMSLRLIERDRNLLYQIERALSRISSGTFGRCESCEDAIGTKRLAVTPFATLCVSCTEEQEETH